MAKLNADAVTREDVERYLDNYSDFAFELSVLSILQGTGLTCWHSGTYEDPVSRKIREFDIRAHSRSTARDGQILLRLAIECKNLRPNYPLIIHRVRRDPEDAFTDLVKSTGGSYFSLRRAFATRVTLYDQASLYPAGEFVGKSSDQVGKRTDGEITTGDQDVFDRISQAFHSAHALLRIAHYDGRSKKAPVFTVVIPMLVIPANRLWVVDYDDAGRVVAGPSLTSYTTYFADRRFVVGSDTGELPASYSLSHLEICAANYLHTRVAELLSEPRLRIAAPDL